MTDESSVSILNTMQQNRGYIDGLASRLQAIASRLNEFRQTQTGVLKIRRAEQRLSSIESELSSLIGYFLSMKKELSPFSFPQATIHYHNWEDFRSETADATIISFLIWEKEKTFQVFASKQGRILTFKGTIPENKGLLKSWISNELNASEKKVIEGVLALG
jgi:hypothetical protein